jgi:type I restriction enzyme R subunit
VPDVLNLVFFKPVKSKIKFMQMIGRGTRLSPSIFGEGKDKECFYIFDWCRNFEYFEKNPNGKTAPSTISLTERIFGLRAEIAFHLQHQKHQEDEYSKAFHDELKGILKEQVATLSDSHISVRSKWEQVSHFKKEESWLSLSEVDVHSLKSDIAPLLPKNTLEPTAKMFDALTLSIQLSLLDEETNADKKIAQVQRIAEILVEKKATLPQVQAKMETLKEVLSVAAWENVSLEWLEKVRKDLRELMQFLKGTNGKWFVVDIEDVISDEGEAEGVPMRVSYKQRIIDFLANNRNLPVLKKIYNIEQLSSEDIDELERILWKELGSKEDYLKYTQGLACSGNVAAFIRSLIGVDRREALDMFSEFLTDSELNAEQEEFLNTIVQYVCENGDITKEIVVNEAPFDERLVVFNAFMIPLGKYIDNIHNVIIPQGTSTGTYAS